MINLIRTGYNAVRDFFYASWEYLKKSNATFNSLGDSLITSAQKDLLNLKGKLDVLWEIQNDDKDTIALYLAAILGKIGFSFIIVGVSLLSSLVKFGFGSFCLLLAGRWLNLITRIVNTGREIISYILDAIPNAFKNILSNALKLISNLVENIKIYGGKFINAALDVLRATWSYIKPVFKFAIDLIAELPKNFIKLAKWVGTKILNVWTTLLDFTKAAFRLVNKLVRNLGTVLVNCLYGAGHLLKGTVSAGMIIGKGTVLSVAALFIETGIANSLSGVAKSMFILSESTAAGVGAFMDGLYAAGNSFSKAFKSIIGYENEVSAHHEQEPGVTVASDIDDAYYQQKLSGNMHYINECLESAGNTMLRVYENEKYKVIGTPEFEDEQYCTEGHNPNLSRGKCTIM